MCVCNSSQAVPQPMYKQQAQEIIHDQDDNRFNLKRVEEEEQSTNDQELLDSKTASLAT